MRPARLIAAAPVIPVLAALWASLGMAGPAAAAVVEVRVEGVVATLHEGRVETTAHRVDGGDGTGLHACAGPWGESPGPTLTGALDDAMRGAGLGWHGTWSDSAGDFLIDAVAGEAATSVDPWSILLNGRPTPVGGCSVRVTEGDRVLLARDAVFRSKTLRLDGPARVEPGEPFAVAVTDERDDGLPVVGATVTAVGPEAPALTAESGADGAAALTVSEPGRIGLKATHPDGIRSNAITVCVGLDGCAEGPPDPPAAPVLIGKIADGQAFLRGAGPLILRGRLRAGDGVQLSLRRAHRRRCSAWSGARRKLVRRGCGARAWFRAAAGDGRWSYRLRRLPPGRYRLEGRAVGAPTRAWRRGVNRVGFTVRRDRLARARLAGRAARYLRRAVVRPDVRRSRPFSAWATLALGLRRDRGAAGAARGLATRSARRAPTGSLARDLAALRALRHGPGRLRAPGPVRRRARMAAELAARPEADGSFEGNVNLTAMAILALPAGPAAERAAGWLAAAQDPSGGFGGVPGAAPDVDTTGLAGWALARAGRHAESRRAALHLRSAQSDDGGFPAMPGGSSNAQSTGLALVGLRAGGVRPARARTEDGITPFHYLALLQRRDGGLRYAPGQTVSPVWVTGQAALGLTRRGRLIAGLSP